MLFSEKKYTALVITLILLILGFILMSGPENNDPDHFNQEIFSFVRITIAPIVILASYVALICIILMQPKTCSGKGLKK